MCFGYMHNDVAFGFANSFFLAWWCLLILQTALHHQPQDPSTREKALSAAVPELQLQGAGETASRSAQRPQEGVRP